MKTTPECTSVSQSLDAVMRADGGRILACLIGQLRDFQLAEDCLQDALESALVHWRRTGLPGSPAGWLLQTARRKAIDRLRRAANFRSKEADIAHLAALEAREGPMELHHIPDERLRLIFTCCHPALLQEASVALTLRTLCGLSTEQIARAFVVTPVTMAQRLVRAKSKIKRAGIGYAIPQPGELGGRVEAVLDVIYLVFNAGFARQQPENGETDLCEEAIRLARLLEQLRPDDPEVEGLLALCLLQNSRNGARVSPSGALVPLDEQDRALWDRAAIAAGVELVDRALARGRPGPFQVQAAIAALHAEAASPSQTDWREIALLYGALDEMRPNPVVRLNRIMALSHARGPELALAALEAVAGDLPNYQPLHAARADLLRRLGRFDEAEAAYGEAIATSDDPAQVQFLEKRLAKARGLARRGTNR